MSKFISISFQLVILITAVFLSLNSYAQKLAPDQCYTPAFIKQLQQAKTQQQAQALNMKARDCYSSEIITIPGKFDINNPTIQTCLGRCMDLWVSSDLYFNFPEKLKSPVSFLDACVNEMSWEATKARGALAGFACEFKTTG